MTKQITLEEALKLVSFCHSSDIGWQVLTVRGDVNGSVCGDVKIDVNGAVNGDVNDGVGGDVNGGVGGYVRGTIKGREWTFIKTPSEKVQRWIDGASEEELLKLSNQLEDNS